MLELNSISDLNIMFMCLGDKLRPIVAKNKDILVNRYKNDPIMKDLIVLYQSSNLSDADIEVIINKNKLSDKFKDDILYYFHKGNELSDAGAELLLKSFKKIVISQLFTDVQSIKDPVDAYNLLNSKILSFDSSIVTKIKENYNLDQIDINEVKESLGKPLPSFLKDINLSFSINGYIRHQLVSIIAAPGCGKSLFCMNETVNFLDQGLKVLYVALGDLMKIDFVTRLSAIKLGISIDEATLDVVRSWTRFCNIMGDKIKNLKILYMDPGTVTIDELEQYLVKDNKEHINYIETYDVIILDYDTNFLSKNEMYQKGEEIYNKASAWSKIAELVFIVGQPARGYADAEIIPQEGMSESWRKAQIIDCGITIGRNKDAATSVGTINLAKMRRGGIRRQFRYMIDQTGKFYVISDSAYFAVVNSKTLKQVERPDQEHDEIIDAIQEGMKLDGNSGDSNSSS